MPDPERSRPDHACGPKGYAPHTRLEITAGDGLPSPAAFDDLENRIDDLAWSAGLTDIGDVRTLIHYRARVEFSFTFDATKTGDG